MSERVSPITDTRNSDLTFAAGDVLAYYSPLGTPAPTAFEDPASPWICLGWIDTSGVTFKLAEALKDINAAGTLDPIRTITTAAPKTFDFTCLEAANPAVRSLMDDVDISLLQPSSGTVASYTLSEIPEDNRYCWLFDAVDNDLRLRSFAPNGKVTTRGNDQQQMSDAETFALTVTLYPALIGSVRASVKRYIDYGDSDLTPFFS
jgi:hypothetical protein